MFDVKDLRATIIPKSDQLNAEQLLAGDMTVTVTGVTVSDSAEQPVTIHYEGDAGRPFKPCKTMRKLLVFAWGHDGTEWRGRQMTLFNDPAVKFGGQVVGGIRISHLSHIDREIAPMLTSTRGKKSAHTVKPLKAKPQARSAKQDADAICMRVESEEATAAALEISEWPKPRLDAAWALLPDAVVSALLDNWPQDQAA